MIETTEQPAAVQAAIPISPRGAALAIGLMSFSALLLELALTRLFSVVLFYHFAFLAISIALLGLGAGAVFAYLRRAKLLSSHLRVGVCSGLCDLCEDACLFLHANHR